MSGTTWIATAALLALGGTSVWLAGQNQQLADRIESLESQRHLAPTTGEATEGAGPSLRGGASAPTLEQLEERITGLTLRLAKTERALQAARAQGGTQGAEGTDLAALAEAPEFQRVVRDVAMELADDVRFRSRLGLTGSPNIPKKPAFHQLAAALELDAVQEEKMRGDLTEMQQTFFAIVSEERDDGVVPLERFAEADQLPDGDPKKARIFIEVLQLKIPGTEETYLKRLIDLQGAMRKKARDYLRPQQREIWANLEVDWMSIKMEE